MDPLNAVITFGVPIAVVVGMVYNFIKRRREYEHQQQRPQIVNERVDVADIDDLKPAAISSAGVVSMYDEASLSTAVIPEQSDSKIVGKAVIPLKTVIDHLNNHIDEVPHFMVIGGTGAGKSTFARLILAYRAERGEQFIILAGKRTQVFADIPSIGRDAIMSDGVLRFDRIRNAAAMLLSEVIRRDNLPFDQRSFRVLNIVIDDASILMSEIEEVVQVARVVGLLGREIKMRLIILTGSKLVKELGFEGRGDLRDHFAIVTYHKRLDGSRETSLRPRFDEKTESPFDATGVPWLAEHSQIDASLAWKFGNSDMAAEGDDTALLRTIITPPSGEAIGTVTPNTISNNASNKNVITLARYTEVLRRLKAGEPQQSIAGAVGVGLGTVNEIAKAMSEDVEV